MPEKQYGPAELFCLGINTLSDLIHLQPGLCHVCIPQKLQRHPYKMALNFVQLFAYLDRVLHTVEDVACFDTLWWQEKIVVLKSFDCIRVSLCHLVYLQACR